MGHGGSSGQNRLSSVLWSEAQTWGGRTVVVSQALGSSSFYSSASGWPSDPCSAGPGPISCCGTQKGALYTWAGVQSFQFLAYQVPFRAGQSLMFQPLHLCAPEQTTGPKEGASSLSTLNFTFLTPLGLCMHGWRGCLSDHTYRLSSPKFLISATQSIYLPSPLREKCQLHYLPFSARAFWGKAGRQTRVGSV